MYIRIGLGIWDKEELRESVMLVAQTKRKRVLKLAHSTPTATLRNDNFLCHKVVDRGNKTFFNCIICFEI